MWDKLNTAVSSSANNVKGRLAQKPSEAQAYLVDMLLHGRRYGLPDTDGSFCSNYNVYIRNHHPLFSICCAYPSHPFNRCDRFLVMTTTLAIALFISTLLQVGHQCDPDSVDVSGLGYRRLQSVPSAQKECEQAQFSPIEQALIVAVVITPIDSLLKALATCGCVQKSCCMFRKLVECMGNVTVCTFCCIGLVFAAAAVIIAFSNLSRPEAVLFAWLVGEAQSYIFWFFLYFPIFFIFYFRDRKKFNNDYPGCVSITEKLRPNTGVYPV